MTAPPDTPAADAPAADTPTADAPATDAPAADTPPPTDSDLRLGLFEASGLRFGVEIGHFSEICMAGALMPMVSARAEVLGALNLRGNIIPVLDPLALCGMTPMQDAPFLVAVLRHGGRLVGLAVEKASGIGRFNRSALQDLYAGEGAEAPVIRYSLLDGKTPVNVIEPPRLFAQRDLPSCPAHQAETRKTGAAGQGAYLTFEAGGATFGLEATRIFGTVPRQRIEAGAVSGSRCLGIIHYLGRKVPVVECSDWMGLGAGISTDTPEIVVVRLPRDRLVGLAVDVIRRIQILQRAALGAPPAQLVSAGSIIFAAYLDPDLGQVFLLDADRLDADPDLQSIAELSDTRSEQGNRSAPLGPHGAAQRQATGPARPKVDRRARRMLIYHAGVRLVSELTEVVCILEYPERVTPLHNQPPALLGFFSHKSASVLLVDLATRLGHAPRPRDSRTRVLLVRAAEAEIGFVVHAVEGIQNAELSYRDEDGRTMSKLSGRDMVGAMDLVGLGGSISLGF